jgi:hypothetical protein
LYVENSLEKIHHRGTEIHRDAEKTKMSSEPPPKGEGTVALIFNNK